MIGSIIVENGHAVGVRVCASDDLEDAKNQDEVPMVEIRAKVKH